MPRVRVKLVSWDEVVAWSRELARKVREAGYRPSVIIAVARGGYVPARLMCDFLGVENLLSIQSQHWTEAAKMAEKALIKFPYKVDLSGHKALLVDDIVDTGDTLMLAKEFVEKEWKPEALKVATLQWISSVAKFKPDFYVVEVKEWVWFQYPWTRLEDVTQFVKRMMEERLKEEGKTEWGLEEVIDGFREWYGISVDESYYRDALKALTEAGFLEEVGEERFRLSKARPT